MHTAIRNAIRERPEAAIIVALFATLATIYSLVTPIFEASDEISHYPVIQHITTTGRLPVQQPGVETLWEQEGSQPPLYYLLGAGLTYWIDTSDLEEVRWRNAHAKLGIHTDPDTKGKIVEAWASGDWDLAGAAKLVAKHLPPGYTLDAHGRVRRNYEKMHEPFLTQAGDRLIGPYLREPPEDPEEARSCIDDETRVALLQIATNPRTDERTVERILDRFAAYGWSVRGFERALLRTMPKHFKIGAPKRAAEPHITKVSTRI